MTTLERLVDLGQRQSRPPEVTEATKCILVHDLAIALSARPLIGHLLTDPSDDGEALDLATGRRVDLASAVMRNGQLVHAFTQDETLLPAMTHVGATSIPTLLALGEAHDASTEDLLAGFATAFAAAEVVGAPVAVSLSGKGVRPTPMIGPVAAVVGAARMFGWPAERLTRAVGRVASVACGTNQPWVDGSQDWLFQISTAGLVALTAAMSSASPWAPARDPFWGKEIGRAHV